MLFLPLLSLKPPRLVRPRTGMKPKVLLKIASPLYRLPLLTLTIKGLGKTEANRRLGFIGYFYSNKCI
jgi:hypothetical protein